MEGSHSDSTRGRWRPRKTICKTIKKDLAIAIALGDISKSPNKESRSVGKEIGYYIVLEINF